MRGRNKKLLFILVDLAGDGFIWLNLKFSQKIYFIPMATRVLSLTVNKECPILCRQLDPVEIFCA